ncbi:MAG: RnfABCDGE type electron transport complex subunit G [Bacteroidales bacterium]|nr:RnfABCDGE type electron transport complex subunit G [Bacteroidales bacterium]MCM1414345.1 RnfABCDGE type electron transport complex subunit G [bacterium]MCM1422227.1 RnfABCDGE type electron transport complex subunit G [bacterium]
MKEMMKNTGILLAITLIAGLLLGVVYQVTKDPIAKQEALAKEKACQEVFADAASFAMIGVESATVEGYAQETIDEVMEAKDGSGELLGYVITVTTKEGYGGDIQFSIGVRLDGTVNGISILSISETAGLGMRAEEVLKPQFAGKNAAQFEYTKSGAAAENQIDAISGATITTNAMTNGVNAGLYYFQTVLGGGSANE